MVKSKLRVTLIAICLLVVGVLFVVSYKSWVPYSLGPDAGYEFEDPVRLQAGGVGISVGGSGYACPTLADVDGDEKLDLVVGQFAGGLMSFFKNVATENELPRYVDAGFVMAGKEPATVPGVW